MGDVLEKKEDPKTFYIPDYGEEAGYTALPWVGSSRLARELLEFYGFDVSHNNSAVKRLRDGIEKKLGKADYSIKNTENGKNAVELFDRAEVKEMICVDIKGHIEMRIEITSVTWRLRHEVLNHEDALEEIAQGRAGKIAEEAAGRINDALHIFKIYTARTEALRKKFDVSSKEGVKIFQKEYMEKEKGKYYQEIQKQAGRTDPNTLNEINEGKKDADKYVYEESGVVCKHSNGN